MGYSKEPEVGDIVYLKSGSPKMTVTKVHDGDVVVKWLRYGSDEMQEATLPIACVKPAGYSQPRPAEDRHDD